MQVNMKKKSIPYSSKLWYSAFNVVQDLGVNN
jgi:hypothetical protein